MNKNDDYLLDTNTLFNITNIINSVTSNNSTTFESLKLQYDKLISCWVICSYSAIIYFENFYFIKYFDKIFIFNGSIEFMKIKNIITKENDFKKFIYDNSIGLIVRDKLLSNCDFINLKRCYMLTEHITFKDDKVFCKYTPYYLIELELKGEILTITIKANNSVCDVNMNNVTTDLKSFIKLVFNGTNKNKLKIHHRILIYYASLE